MTTQQKKVMDNASRFHEVKVWANYPNGSIRLCVYNKNKKEFEFLTIMPNGESKGKEYNRMKVDDQLLNIWKQITKVGD